MKAYLFDGKFKTLERPQAVLSTGFSGETGRCFYTGWLGRAVDNGDLLRDHDNYLSSFPFKITAGFSLDMQRWRNGVRLNYGYPQISYGRGLTSRSMSNGIFRYCISHRRKDV